MKGMLGEWQERIIKWQLRGNDDMEELHFQDRNKTELTHNITLGAISHLRFIGAKAIETEVPVAEKWVADLSALWSPTPTECLQSKLLPPRRKISRLFEFEGTQIDIPEDDPEQAWDDTYDKLPWCITIVHEVKTSYADFARDDKFSREPIADLQILSYPIGVISEDKLPKHWWLWGHAQGGAVRHVSKYPKLFNPTDRNRFVISASIAERQHNKVHNKFFSDMQKKQTIDRATDKAATNLRGMADTVLKVAKGEMKPEEAFAYYFRNKKKYELEYVQEKLNSIYGILKGSV